MGGGALMAQAIHAVDLLQWFAGVPREVYGMTSRCVHTGIEAEDNVAAALRFAGGALGTIEASTAVWPGWQRRIEICGDRGSVALEDDRIARWEFAESGPDDAAVLAASGGAALGSGAAAPNAISELGHRRQFADFVGALREGRAPAIDGNEARKAVVLIRALYESAARGVSVTPFF
ncbi:MAG: Gfo/Idh/MocA family oxidoreductase [Lacunisphaera sp.]